MMQSKSAGRWLSLEERNFDASLETAIN